jgi:hypothetical protein
MYNIKVTAQTKELTDKALNTAIDLVSSVLQNSKSLPDVTWTVSNGEKALGSISSLYSVPSSRRRFLGSNKATNSMAGNILDLSDIMLKDAMPGENQISMLSSNIKLSVRKDIGSNLPLSIPSSSAMYDATPANEIELSFPSGMLESSKPQSLVLVQMQGNLIESRGPVSAAVISVNVFSDSM